jgi:hypothetical protein
MFHAWQRVRQHARNVHTMSEQQSPVPVQLAPQTDVTPLPTTRRGRSALWAWAAVGLTTAAAVSLLGYFAWDDARSHQQTSEEMHRPDDLTRQVALLKQEGARLDLQLIGLRAENTRLQTRARNPATVRPRPWEATDLDDPAR